MNRVGSGGRKRIEGNVAISKGNTILGITKSSEGLLQIKRGAVYCHSKRVEGVRDTLLSRVGGWH